MSCGCGRQHLARTPMNNTHGILRLNTKGEPCWLLVTRNALLQLGETCVKLAEDLEAVSKLLSGVQLIEQCLGLFQIERVEAFGEPAVDRSEKIAADVRDMSVT